MKSTLHQHTGASEGDSFINLVTDLLEGSDVSVGSAGASIEGTERTNHIADICVINIAIDDVGNHVIGVPALADFIGGNADSRDVVGLEQSIAIGRRQAPARDGLIQNVLYLARHVRSLLLSSAISKIADEEIKSTKSTPINLTMFRVSSLLDR